MNPCPILQTTIFLKCLAYALLRTELSREFRPQVTKKPEFRNPRILHGKLGVVLHDPPIQSVDQCVPSSIGCACTAISLFSFSETRTLPPQSPLVDLPLPRSGEREAVTLQVQYSTTVFWTSLYMIVLYGVLVTQPVVAFHCVVHDCATDGHPPICCRIGKRLVMRAVLKPCSE